MLFGLPLQVFSSIASFLVSFFASRQKAKTEIEEARNKRFMELIAAQSESTARFMEYEQQKQQDPQFSYTRRVLALGLTFGTCLL